MRKAFATAAILAALASCDAFGGSNDATPSEDAGLDATTRAEGSTIFVDGQAPSEAAALDGGGDAGSFCAKANTKGHSTIACEDFEGTEASHGFTQEATGGLQANVGPVEIGGAAPIGLVAGGNFNGSTSLAGVNYTSSLLPTADVRLRFLLQVRELVAGDGVSASHVQVASMLFGTAGWSLRFYRTGTAPNFSTTLGSVIIEDAVRTPFTTYEIWLDVVHADAGGLDAQVSIDGAPVGGKQHVDLPPAVGWTVRAGGLLDESQDRVIIAIDDVLLQEL